LEYKLLFNQIFAFITSSVLQQVLSLVVTYMDSNGMSSVYAATSLPNM